MGSILMRSKMFSKQNFPQKQQPFYAVSLCSSTKEKRQLSCILNYPHVRSVFQFIICMRISLLFPTKYKRYPELVDRCGRGLNKRIHMGGNTQGAYPLRKSNWAEKGTTTRRRFPPSARLHTCQALGRTDHVLRCNGCRQMREGPWASETTRCQHLPLVSGRGAHRI